MKGELKERARVQVQEDERGQERGEGRLEGLDARACARRGVQRLEQLGWEGLKDVGAHRLGL